MVLSFPCIVRLPNGSCSVVAPRNVAIINGTLAAAIGLGLQLWIAGLAIWLIGHGAAVLAAKRDPQFMDVLKRHIRHKPFLEA